MSKLHEKLFILFLLFRISAGLMMAETDNTNIQIFEQATFGAGCFWCVEAIFERLVGVDDVQVGYTGGEMGNPSYEDVCSGKSGHVEVIQLDFNPQIISFKKLLDIFWKSHDPTTLNRQGSDTGTQYRSAIFYHSEKQQKIAEKSLKTADNSSLYEDPIITEISPFTTFYLAEDYHQDYYRTNPNVHYCRVVIQPKLNKFFDLD